MFSENQKISVRQIRRTMTLEMLGVSSLLLPGYLAANSKSDGLFALVFGAAAAFFLLCLWERFTRRQNFYEALERCGRFARRIVSVFYGSAFLVIGSYVLYLLARLVQEQLLNEKYEPLILVTLTVAAVFGLLKGIEPRVRVYEVLFWFLLIPLAVILILAGVSVNPEYWPPVAASQPGRFAGSVYVCFLFFALSSLYLLFQPHCNRPRRAVRGAQAGLLGVLAVNLIIYLILLGIFQSGLLAQMEFPIITLMAVVKLPGGFFERQDALMMGIWFFCLFSLLNSMLFYGKEMLQNGMCRAKKKNRIWACACGGAVLTLAVLFLHTRSAAPRCLEIFVCGVIPLMLAIPFFLFLAGGRKGGAE